MRIAVVPQLLAMTYGSFERLLGPSQALFAGSLKEYGVAEPSVAQTV